MNHKLLGEYLEYFCIKYEKKYYNDSNDYYFDEDYILNDDKSNKFLKYLLNKVN